MNDSELILGILRRDRQALRQLVETYREKVIKTAFYFIGNMQEAEDLSQDIFIEIMNAAGRFRKEAALSTWIYRITVNKSLNRVRQLRRRELYRWFSPGQAGTPGTREEQEPYIVQQEIEDRERREIIDRAIKSLPENQRIAFVLHKFDEIPYAGIAEIMNISHSSVESLIHRARQNLQKRLAPHFKEYVKQ